MSDAIKDNNKCKKTVKYGLIFIILFVLLMHYIVKPSLGVELRTTLEVIVFIGISTYFSCKSTKEYKIIKKESKK